MEMAKTPRLARDMKKPEKPFCYHEGRLYFSRQLERRVFFFMTVAMLVWGLLEKIGIL